MHTPPALVVAEFAVRERQVAVGPIGVTAVVDMMATVKQVLNSLHPAASKPKTNGKENTRTAPSPSAKSAKVCCAVGCHV